MSMTGNNRPLAIIATGIKSRDGTKEPYQISSIKIMGRWPSIPDSCPNREIKN
jgi:hypothetical protein